MRGLRIALSMALACGFAAGAQAQIPSWGISSFQAPPDPHWQKVTVEDVEGAYTLLHDNHPGAAPSLHDTAFQKRLDDAHALALSRAHKVTSYQGYIWTLAGFATDMGDKHIWSRPTFVLNLPWFAGIIGSKRGDNYVVTDTEEPQAALMGATLVSCDGRAAADLARTNLGGFHAVWSIGAQQTQAAPWLFVDEGNPFITRPNTCVFDKGGAQQTVTLDWERTKRDLLLPRLKKAIGAGAAGFGVRRVGDGYWIALQDLAADQTQDVVKAVEAQKDALRAAPFVVLDVRGNGGGDSEVGVEIAESLMGKEAVDPILASAPSNDCSGPDGIWRASPSNVNNLQFLLDTVGKQAGPQVQKLLAQQLQMTKAAYDAGKPFSAPTNCPGSPQLAPAKTQIASAMHGRLILLTDNLCFSSCLIVTHDFRALGAYHIGQTTDAATHFVEVREQYMPSGYSLFSTLQSVSDPNGADEEGPFAPYLPYQGDIADTAALEKWVTDVVVPKAAGGNL